MNELVDKTIREIYIDEQCQEYLKFVTDEGILIFEAQGDCCSESWFADVICINALLDAKVNVVEEVDMPGVESSEDSRCRQEWDCVYGYKFQTSKGWADIVFRNSSNGYYGGWLEYMSEDEYKLRRRPEVRYVKLTEDYSA